MSNAKVSLWGPTHKDMKEFYEKPAMSLERIQEAAISWPEALSRLLSESACPEGVATYLQLRPEKLEMLSKRAKRRLQHVDGWRHVLVKRYAFRGDQVIEKNGQWRLEYGQETVSEIAIRLLEVEILDGKEIWSVSMRQRGVTHLFTFERPAKDAVLCTIQVLFKEKTSKAFQVSSKIWKHFEDILCALSNPVIK